MVSKLPAFFAAYPGIAVELAASQDPSKIVEDGFDLAIHSGNLPDATLVTRRFAETKIILVATPEYLSKHGTPTSPEDLPRFPGILFVERGAIVPWLFGTEPEETHIVPAGPFRTGDAEQMRMAVLEHLGMAQSPAWIFASELKAGTLQRLFPSLERRVPMFTVRAAGRHVPAKVRVFVEHLEKTFAMCSQFNPNPFSRTL
jgi:DNA-binding transcriptional LysR family regulator